MSSYTPRKNFVGRFHTLVNVTEIVQSFRIRKLIFKQTTTFPWAIMTPLKGNDVSVNYSCPSLPNYQTSFPLETSGQDNHPKTEVWLFANCATTSESEQISWLDIRQPGKEGRGSSGGNKGDDRCT